MSMVDRSKAFDRAIDLTIHQDHIIQDWTGRYVTIQTSLVVAEAALLAWKGQTGGLPIKILATLIAFLGMVFVWAITAIIMRECEWQARYVEMVKRAEEIDPYLYQFEYKPIHGPNKQSIFFWLRIVLIPAWGVFVVFLWYFWP